MKNRVIQVNVRLTEGGAAQVAFALYRSLSKHGFQSGFAYGYSKGARAHPDQEGLVDVYQITRRREAVVLFAQNRLLGLESRFISGGSTDRLLNVIDKFDIVHFHVLHSYYINWRQLIEAVSGPRFAEKKIIWTLHDHWVLTGRCAFIDECHNWERECGNCKTNKNYPPSLLDFSSYMAIERRRIISENISKIEFVSPSKHLAKDFLSIYKNARIKIIPNSIGSEIEQAISEQPDVLRPPVPGNLKVLVIAHDLSYEGKTDQAVIRQIAVIPGLRIVTVGKNSPFEGDNIENLGEIRDRGVLAQIYASVDALIFTSKVDNFPLVICEALCSGTPVLATKSPAAAEVLSYVDGRDVDIDDLLALLSNGAVFFPYRNISTRSDLKRVAMHSFSSEAMQDSYLQLYRSV